MMRGAAHGKGDLAPQGARALVPTQRPHPSPAGQFVHFAGVGIVSTVSYAFLFALFYGTLGGLGADVIALGLCALGNLIANRRYTFGDSGPAGRRHYYLSGLALALLPLVSTLGALVGTSAAGIASLPALIVILTAVNLLSTVVRFYVLRAASATKGRAQ